MKNRKSPKKKRINRRVALYELRQQIESLEAERESVGVGKFDSYSRDLLERLKKKFMSVAAGKPWVHFIQGGGTGLKK